MLMHNCHSFYKLEKAKALRLMFLKPAILVESCKFCYYLQSMFIGSHIDYGFTCSIVSMNDKQTGLIESIQKRRESHVLSLLICEKNNPPKSKATASQAMLYRNALIHT